MYSALRSYISGSKLKKLTSAIAECGDAIELVCDYNDICKVIEHLKKDKKTDCNILMSICGVDYYERKTRFSVVYNLLSITLNHRVRVILNVSETDIIPSVSSIHSCAVWYERETWDMYGIIFKNNPDMRRILTDYNFPDHPMRKDFPLTGYQEVRYDYTSARVTQTPVDLPQEYRTFDFSMPWEGTKYLPGDEKAS